MVSFSVSLLWLLAMLAAAAHVRDAGRTVGNGVRVACAFMLTLPAAMYLSPQPNWVGVLLALGVFWRLIEGRMPRACGLLAGSSTALAAALQITAGASLWLAVGVTGSGLALAFLWAGAPQDSARLRETLLTAIAIGLPPVALMNDILFGWHSAAVLGQGTSSVPVPVPPVWAIVVVGMGLVTGLIRGILVKR